MGVFNGEDWKKENVGLGLRWIPPELGDCGCFTCTSLQQPQRMEVAPNPLYKGSKTNEYMAEWSKLEESFFAFMDSQPVLTCCGCADAVDKDAALEAIDKEWIPKANEQLNGVMLDVFLWRYTGGGATATGMKYDIVIRFVEE